MKQGSPSFCVTVLTYNRRKTIEPRLPSYLDQKPDMLNLVDNASTDGTRELLNGFLERHQDSQAIRLDRNLMNLGFTRSLLKSFYLCEQDYQVILSDEDAPSPSFLDTYRRVVDTHGPQGVIARATPYPKVWMVPDADATEVLHDDDDVTVIKPGIYAAHLASYQSVYLGGLCVAPALVKNTHLMTLERGCYPQRFIAMDAAFHGGLTLLKSPEIGKFPALLASDNKERMTPRLGDWGVAEYIALAQMIAHFYPAGDLPAPVHAALTERQKRFAYTRTPIYFKMAAAQGEHHALNFLRYVQQSCDAFARPLFWDYVHSHINATFDAKSKALFTKCCDQLQQEMMTAKPRGSNQYLHDHTGFGNAPVSHAPKT